MAFSKTARRDIALDDETGKVIFADGDFTFVSGDAAVAQSIAFALKLLLGEWFANPDAGVPWFTSILGTKFDLERIRGEFYRVVVGIEGVQRITRLAVSFDNAQRQLTVEYEVATTFSDSLIDTVVLSIVDPSAGDV